MQIKKPTYPLKDRSHIASYWKFDSEPPVRCYVDRAERWSIQVFRAIWPGTHVVGIRCNADSDIEVNWSTIQELKEAVFPGKYAIEVYPPPNNVVDVAPMRWLFVFDKPLPYTIERSVNAPNWKKL